MNTALTRSAQDGVGCSGRQQVSVLSFAAVFVWWPVISFTSCSYPLMTVGIPLALLSHTFTTKGLCTWGLEARMPVSAAGSWLQYSAPGQQTQQQESQALAA